MTNSCSSSAWKWYVRLSANHRNKDIKSANVFNFIILEVTDSLQYVFKYICVIPVGQTVQKQPVIQQSMFYSSTDLFSLMCIRGRNMCMTKLFWYAVKCKACVCKTYEKSDQSTSCPQHWAWPGRWAGWVWPAADWTVSNKADWGSQSQTEIIQSGTSWGTRWTQDS